MSSNLSPPKYDIPALPLSGWQNSESKHRRSEVVVELSCTQTPPLFPMELQQCVSPDKWENRVRAILRISSQYSKPMLEKYWMLLTLILTFVAPLATYYIALAHFHFNRDEFESQQEINQQNLLVWESRLIAIGVALAVWSIMFLPMVIWKHIGRVRVNKMVDGWAKDDIRTASSYVTIPTWNVKMPGVFKDGTVLTVSYPAALGSFDSESYLPPYIATPPDAAPSYEATKRLSTLQGQGKFGEIPLYNDNMGVAV